MAPPKKRQRTLHCFGVTSSSKMPAQADAVLSGVVDAVPSDAAPSDAAPSDAAPSDAAPSNAAPSDAAPSDAAPSDAAPSDAAPCDAAPCDAAPSDAAPSDAAPSDAARSDAAPSDAAPSDAAPSDAAPSDAAPSDAALSGADDEVLVYEDTTIGNHPGGATGGSSPLNSELTLEDRWPKVWDAKAVALKREQYPWLIAKAGMLGCIYCIEAPVPSTARSKGCGPSKEWTSFGVGFSAGDARPKQLLLTLLRNKIRRHLTSNAHCQSKLVHERKRTTSNIEMLHQEKFREFQSSTEKVFLLAYNIAKMGRPFSDLPDNIACSKKMGTQMGNMLHTDKSCAAIVNSIAVDIRTTICKSAIANKSKLSVLIDESTTISGLTCLVVHVRGFVADHTSIFFLDIVELKKTNAQSIVDSLLKVLTHYGFCHTYLLQHFVCFASDGASVMTGRVSGVGKLLLEKYPNLVLWHCANHRLELAVGDAIKEVSGINHFKVFMDELHKLYNQSAKNLTELKQCAADLDVNVKKLTNILDTRWCDSSRRSAKAVWKSFPALAEHFKMNHPEAKKAKFKGLFRTLASPNFVLNLAVMIDALEEVSTLSLVLQGRDVGLVKSHKAIQQSIKAFEGMGETPGEYVKKAEACVSEGFFEGVPLEYNGAVKKINSLQFFRSLANSLSNRLLTVASKKGANIMEATNNSEEYSTLLEQVSLLEPNLWPTNYDTIPLFGEPSIKKLAMRFQVDAQQATVGFRLLKAAGGRTVPSELKSLLLATECIPISTADCERSFSVMNRLLSKTRNRLQVGNLSSLMAINSLGPPIQTFEPKRYVQSWLRKGHHSANNASCREPLASTSVEYNSHLHKLL